MIYLIIIIAGYFILREFNRSYYNRNIKTKQSTERLGDHVVLSKIKNSIYDGFYNDKNLKEFMDSNPDLLDKIVDDVCNDFSMMRDLIDDMWLDRIDVTYYKNINDNDPSVIIRIGARDIEFNLVTGEEVGAGFKFVDQFEREKGL